MVEKDSTLGETSHIGAIYADFDMIRPFKGLWLAFCASALAASTSEDVVCDTDEVALSVTVFCGSFPDKDLTGRSDPYCTVSAGGTTKKTKTIANDNNPCWDKELELGCVPESAVITVHCFDEDLDKDDTLLDEQIHDWYDATDSNQTYHLGGSSHWVEVEVSWLQPPTPSPSISASPTTSPSMEPTTIPTMAPSLSFRPSPAPSGSPLVTGASGVQYSASRLYDESQRACYDSPVLGQRVQLDRVKVVARFDDSYFIADGPGAWHGLRVLGLPPDEDCGIIFGIVGEYDGETVLSQAVFKSKVCTADNDWKRTSIYTGVISPKCGLIAAESFEGVAVYIGSARLVEGTLDDGSGPAYVLGGLPDKGRAVVKSVSAIVRYVDSAYRLLVVSYEELVSVQEFTEPPTPAIRPPPSTSKSRSKSGSGLDATPIVLAIVLPIVVLSAGFWCFFSGRASTFYQGLRGIPSRRRYSDASQGHAYSEQAFEMGLVDSITHDSPIGDLGDFHAANPLRHNGLDLRP